MRLSNNFLVLFKQGFQLSHHFFATDIGSYMDIFTVVIEGMDFYMEIAGTGKYTNLYAAMDRLSIMLKNTKAFYSNHNNIHTLRTAICKGIYPFIRFFRIFCGILYSHTSILGSIDI